MTEFDPAKYKQTTRDQWQAAAQAWNRWAPVLEQWLGAATEHMLDLADLREGTHVLDLAPPAPSLPPTLLRTFSPLWQQMPTGQESALSKRR